MFYKDLCPMLMKTVVINKVNLITEAQQQINDPLLIHPSYREAELLKFERVLNM